MPELKTIPFLKQLPAEAVQMPVEEVLSILETHFGDRLYKAFESDRFPGPVQKEKNCSWLKKANTVGINVRTLGDFWSIIPYALTLPVAQNAIHLLPIFEPGVVSSLYGPSSWNINPAFFNSRLAALFPHLNTVEKQLSLIIRLLHLMGKSVGLDVIPHVDRFAESVLGNPSLFEWIERKNDKIVDHSSALHVRVSSNLHTFLKRRGSLLTETEFPATETEFFHSWPEKLRLRMMFGEPEDYEGRLNRRIEMVDLLYNAGFETLPATMAPPYRGIEVDPDPAASVTDDKGRVWRDYRITQPQPFSRVFGPLARFKLYEPLNDNRDWQLDFERPHTAAWHYVCGHYRGIQARFDFDFMRGDMSHVQMRPDGVPDAPDAWYDLLGAVKQSVLPEKPYFGYFAESFLAPPDTMAYGDEMDHLEASFADSTLGDLQSEPVGTERFVQEFARYDELLRTRQCAPNFTLMTADKDDPRFDSFYLNGNETRYFIGLFLTDMPSYMGLGFECRDPHLLPAPNEHYTKLYVFEEKQGPKRTQGPFIWGQNRALHHNLTRQKELTAEIFADIEGAETRWLIAPDASGTAKVIAWTQLLDTKFVFMVNMDQENGTGEVWMDFPEGEWGMRFSTEEERSVNEMIGKHSFILGAGECLVLGKI